jgi:60 kDa SS-A/Ro ribonucleoprotein
MSKSYSSFVSTKKSVAPLVQAIPGKEKEMVVNSTGAMVFDIGSWKQLDRFLILGAEGPTYYATQANLVKENCTAAQKCIKEDGVRVVNKVVEVSLAGRAPKQEPGLFVLALCASYGDEKTKAAANAALPKVARTGTSLFAYVGFINDLRGWGRGIKKSVSNWFNSKTPENLAYQVVKYKQRNGWSFRDVLRLSHSVPQNDTYNDIFKYALKGWDSVGNDPHPNKALQIIWASEKAKTLTKASDVAKLVADYGLTWEMIPTNFLNDLDVWESLLPNTKPEALMRNLGRLTSNGFLAPLSKNINKVVEVLTDEKAIKDARLHPLKLLVAMRTYSQGKGDKGSLTWNPNPKIVSALEDGFYKSFGSIVPTGKNTLLSLDISGSMGSGNIAGLGSLNPRECSAVMAMVAARTEPNYHFVGFSDDLIELNINHKMSLNDVIKNISNLNFGSTNISAPFHWARKNKIPVEAFYVYTDNEVNAYGGMWGSSYKDAQHPWEALKQYRKETGIPAKLAVVGMTATNFSIASRCEPNTAMDVVGFDTAAPTIMSDFVRE